ncbi:type II toxin-antitoxin system RelE/ParE family toxin [Puia dinghuensis]|uniref:Toxin, RelE family protein n=1 Tax=Puia dinghuensis TaxID=1792502 RepID=A0A8J2XSM7_9BACT|nr:type II toxin-antitoxin system RelE/ParE family toxin [Puia dinghuensis]GGB10507.1 toxin, RelE family protein [Puia dinghuensis]
MSYQVVFQSEAVIDTQTAFEWYEQQRSGLGYELIEEIEEALERLSRHPQHYSAPNQKYRKLRIKRFPYLIIFEIEDLKVIVIAVRRISQEPIH